ncbi:hypothetical protein BGW80DRAFT_1561453 [Lactifluus volemus]|nr:hypothetical protein BGW80DRAFT_1561453 [Lactifluus volemus]
MRRFPILPLPLAIIKDITPIRVLRPLTSPSLSAAISLADFKLTELSNGQCLGAIFEYTSNNNSPAWIVGDTFLKNVYSVFRANPASVGFAALASNAQSLVDAGGVPTPTIGSVSASVTGSGSAHSSGALHRAIPPLTLLLCVMIASLLTLMKKAFSLALSIWKGHTFTHIN